jgi:hypothetical protein
MDTKLLLRTCQLELQGMCQVLSQMLIAISAFQKSLPTEAAEPYSGFKKHMPNKSNIQIITQKKNGTDVFYNPFGNGISGHTTRAPP